MRAINRVVVHCADTPPNVKIGADEIRRWHTDPKPRGEGWDDIGYHWVVCRDGTVEAGRPEEEQGAHVRGYNADSIGICLVGGEDGLFDFTRMQMSALEAKLTELERRFPQASIVGHRDLDSGKLCPGFDVILWWHGR